SCLVIGVEGAALESASELSPGSLGGVTLLVPAGASTQTLQAAGAGVAVLVAPSTATSSQELVFDARTAITALRADRPDVQIVIDAEAFTSRGVPIDELRPYVDAVIGEGWMRLPRVTTPSVDDLIAASLVPGVERVLLPVEAIDWRAVQEFASRRPSLVEVTGARRLTAAEILARY